MTTISGATVDRLAAGSRAAARAVAARAGDDAAAALRSTAPERVHAPLFTDAAQALDALGTGPLTPTGAVQDALAAGRLLRTGADDRLDELERVLRDGTIDRSDATTIGAGVNGPLQRVSIVDDASPGAAPLLAVEKPASAQAAQEELGWRLARVLGIDHLVPAVARRADGIARIEFRSGRSLSQEGVFDVDRLEQALARVYLDDAALGLSPAEAAQAARVDRQLLQVFDYLLANNDRHLTNGLFDASRGVSFIDAGHAGRGTVASNGGSELVPALREFQAGREGGRVELDDAVVDYLRRRVRPDDLRAIHAAVFDARGIAGPEYGSIGHRFLGHVSDTGYREGMVRRLEHALERRGYAHAAPTGSDADMLPPMANHHERLVAARGVRDVRAAFMHGDMVGAPPF